MIQEKKKIQIFFGTRHGTIYNITQSHTPNIQGIQLSLADFYQNIEILKQLPVGMNLNKFLGLKQDTDLYLSPYDFYKKQGMSGCDKNNIIKLKCNKGYLQFNYQMFEEVSQIIKPKYLVTFTQYPSNIKDHKKQSNNSFKRAIQKTTTYLKNNKKLDNIKLNSKILAPIHGGKNKGLVSRSLEQILDYEVDGFVVCDFGQHQTLEQRQAIYQLINERLKQVQNKQFILALAGFGKINDIQHAIKYGFTVFQVNQPFKLAEKGIALVKNTNGQYQQKIPQLKTQLSPLDAKCQCYACTRHSQSYIAHLISCFQLNAKVLLSIHNTQVYLDFLKQYS